MIRAALALALLLAASCGGESAPPAPREAPPKEPAAAPVARPLLLVGLDGATWDVIDPLLAEGALPNLAKLIAAGSRGPLATFEPTLSPLIWTTIATGFGPRVHGIDAFTAKLPGTGETAIVTSNMRRVPALWNALSARGTTVGVVGWWATYPAEEVNGFVVSDQANDLRRDSYRRALDLDAGAGADAAVDPHAVFPPELGAQLAERLALPTSIDRAQLARFFALPPGRDDLLDAPTVDDDDILSVFKFAYLIDRSFLDAGLAAFAARRPTFAAIYLNGLDAAEHHFWKHMAPAGFAGVDPAEAARYRDVIRNYYAYMDEALGRLLALYPLDGAVVVLVSDHGHEANPEHDPKSADHYDRVCSGGHEHAPPGVIVIAGADAARGADLAGATVLDVAPTVLALLGAPVGEEMPGRVLDRAIAPAFLAAHPVRTAPWPKAAGGAPQAPIRSPMGEALKQKLKGLGYIE